MAENSRIGREPLRVAEIGQDFCNRVYGEPPCNASLNENFIAHSEDFQDPYWLKLNVAATGNSDTVQGIFLEEWEDTFTNGGLEVDPPTNFQPPTNQTYCYSCHYLETVASNLLYLFIELDVDGAFQNVQIWVDTSTGVVTVDNTRTDVPVTQGDIDLGGGLHRVYMTIQVPVGNTVTFTTRALIFDGPIYVGGVQIDRSDTTPRIYQKTDTAEKFKTGSQKCFNTRTTCQDPTNYDKGVLPLKFVDNRQEIPKDGYYIPSLEDVNVSSAKLNPGGANSSVSALGKRATISLTFMDHAHDDRIVDLYRLERPYDPIERGTFWTKWRARNQYYMQRPITLRTGYLKDGAIVDEITRDFVITGFSGPNAQGIVTITGKDVLTLAEDAKAQAPFPSEGKLNANITSGAGSLVLKPSGIGAKYPASGFVRVKKEVMSFTRSGDTLTISRGQFGTDADSHDADTTVQLCYRVQSEKPQDILYDLLNVYAGIPASYLDKAQWDAEALDYLPRLYTAIVTEPMGVSKLIGEMCQQMYFTIWFDERIGKVQLKSVRLAQEDEITDLDDFNNFLSDSISWRDLSDELITQVWVYYGQINPTEKIDQGSNFSTLSITADPSAEGPDKHNLRRVKTVYSRWIDSTNASAAEDLGQRILSRYGNAPRQATFKLDAKDGALWLADYVRATNRLRVDAFGNPTPVNLQIFEAEESNLGTEFRYVAQEFIPALIGGEGVGDPNDRTIPITSDLLNVNLRALHDAIFGAPEGTETVTFVVRDGVTLGGDTAGGGVNVSVDQRVTTNDFYNAGNSAITGGATGQVPFLQRASIGSPRTFNAGDPYEALGAAAYTIVERPVSNALRTGTWPAGVTLKLILEGGARVLGEAGNASCHHTQSAIPGFTPVSGIDVLFNSVPGGDGGAALLIENEIEITNGGTVAGGGGGGASVTFLPYDDQGHRLDSVFGGGGGGFVASSTKGNLVFDDTPVTAKETFTDRSGAAGNTTTGGSGGLKRHRFGIIANINQEAGRGGNLAAAGADASFSSSTIFNSNNYPNFADGGQAGKAVSAGANLITWVNRGDVRGTESN